MWSQDYEKRKKERYSGGEEADCFFHRLRLRTN